MASANVTHNAAGSDKTITWGPTLGITANLFEKKLDTGFSVSYNTNSGNGSVQGSTLNMRCNTSYTFRKRHMVSLILINQRREVKARDTTTCSYTYRF